MSDSLMKSQELDLSFAANPETDTSNTNSAIDDAGNTETLQPLQHHADSNFLPSVFGCTNQSKIWSDSNRNDSLATFSSELFSSSVPFLSVNLKQQTEGFDNDVIQGKKQVSVPPGFHSSSEAKHVAEISQKLANFVIETDTEASITATEIGENK